jgi:hypothetical protein
MLSRFRFFIFGSVGDYLAKSHGTFAEVQEASMSRMTIVLLAATFLCASSQIALADETGAITGGVGGAVAGAVVGGPVGAVVGGDGGAAIGNSMTNHRRYHRGYAYHPYHHHYDQY